MWRDDLQLYFDLGIIGTSILNGNQLRPLDTSGFFGDYKYGTYLSAGIPTPVADSDAGQKHFNYCRTPP